MRIVLTILPSMRITVHALHAILNTRCIFPALVIHDGLVYASSRWLFLVSRLLEL